MVTLPEPQRPRERGVVRFDVQYETPKRKLKISVVMAGTAIALMLVFVRVLFWPPPW